MTMHSPPLVAGAPRMPIREAAGRPLAGCLSPVHELVTRTSVARPCPIRRRRLGLHELVVAATTRRHHRSALHLRRPVITP